MTRHLSKGAKTGNAETFRSASAGIELAALALRARKADPGGIFIPVHNFFPLPVAVFL